MAFSVCKSDYFIDKARDICLHNSNHQQINHSNNYYSPDFLNSYIMSATALEAFINERIAIALEILKRRINGYEPDEQHKIEDIRQKAILDKVFKIQNVRDKYDKLTSQLWNKNFDKNKTPFIDFSILIDIRNDIIHYKMPFYDEHNFKPKWLEYLILKDIFLPSKVTEFPEFFSCDQRIWIDEICTFKGAKWAYNTACAMIRQFSGMAEGEIQYTIGEFVDYFQEII